MTVETTKSKNPIVRFWENSTFGENCMALALCFALVVPIAIGAIKVVPMMKTHHAPSLSAVPMHLEAVTVMNTTFNVTDFHSDDKETLWGKSPLPVGTKEIVAIQLTVPRPAKTDFDSVMNAAQAITTDCLEKEKCPVRLTAFWNGLSPSGNGKIDTIMYSDTVEACMIGKGTTMTFGAGQKPVIVCK